MVNSFPLLYPWSRRLLVYLLSPLVHLFQTFPQKGIIQYMAFCAWLLSQTNFISFSQKTAEMCNYGFRMRPWWRVLNFRVGLLIVIVSCIELEQRSWNNIWKPHVGIRWEHRCVLTYVNWFSRKYKIIFLMLSHWKWHGT